jgi:hypothetical protein
VLLWLGLLKMGQTKKKLGLLARAIGVSDRCAFPPFCCLADAFWEKRVRAAFCGRSGGGGQIFQPPPAFAREATNTGDVAIFRETKKTFTGLQAQAQRHVQNWVSGVSLLDTPVGGSVTARRDFF